MISIKNLFSKFKRKKRIREFTEEDLYDEFGNERHIVVTCSEELNPEYLRLCRELGRYGKFDIIVRDQRDILRMRK